MLKTIAEIGKVVTSFEGDDILDFLIPESSNYKNLIGLNFDTVGDTIDIELIKSADGDKSLSRDVLKRFIFIPAEKGNRPQFLATTKNILYLISQTLPNIFRFLDYGIQ